MDQLIDWSTFGLGFWHPFGSHGGESRDVILQRKRAEVTANGWTLWSFQHRTALSLWGSTINEEDDRPIFVLCSDSPHSTDPTGAVGHCALYRPCDSLEWTPIPDTIRIPHPLGGRQQASAFVVDQVATVPADVQPDFGIAWLRTSLGSRGSGRLMETGERIRFQREAST